MTSSFLDKAGLTYLWSKITALVNTKQNTLTFDSTPTANSTNPVTSAGIKAYVDQNAGGGGGSSPVESGTGSGSVQTKEFTDAGYTYTQSALGVGSFAEGTNTIARGQGAHVEGVRNVASGSGAHAEGYHANIYITTTITTTSANTKYVTYTGNLITTSHVGCYLYCPDFGSPSAKKITNVNTSSNQITLEKSVGPIVTSVPAIVLKSGSFDVGTHSEGRATVAECNAAHSEGGYTVAGGECSHAEGSNTSATASYAHSEGYYTSATAVSAHAEGNYTMALGQNSHAEGYYTKASSSDQHVEGKFNIADTNSTYAHITGIGTSESNRKNGFTVDWSGNGQFAGKVSAGTTSSPASVVNNNDLTTKQYVDNAVGGSSSPFIDGQGAKSAMLEAGYIESWGNSYSNSAYGIGSVAEGLATYIPSDADCAHAEGYSTQAGAACSHTEGGYTYIDGTAYFSHAEGYHTLASSVGSHVEGVLNEEDNDHQYVHITGIGYMDDNTGEPVHKNGFTVDWGGNGQFAGAITIADSLGTVTLNAARLRALLALVQNLPADTLMPGSEPYVYFDPYGGGYE